MKGLATVAKQWQYEIREGIKRAGWGQAGGGKKEGSNGMDGRCEPSEELRGDGISRQKTNSENENDLDSQE